VHMAEVKAQILRTLATLCCVEESVLQLHEVCSVLFYDDTFIYLRVSPRHG
jgi:hypothetical protein